MYVNIYANSHPYIYMYVYTYNTVTVFLIILENYHNINANVELHSIKQFWADVLVQDFQMEVNLSN